MHDALFQHSVFGAIVFLIVSNTGVYKFVKETLFSVTGFKADGNTLQFIHAVVFAVIMYFGSMYLFAPLLTEGITGGKNNETFQPNGVPNTFKPGGGRTTLIQANPSSSQGGAAGTGITAATEDHGNLTEDGRDVMFQNDGNRYH
jgi:hypothetical protein